MDKRPHNTYFLVLFYLFQMLSSGLTSRYSGGHSLFWVEKIKPMMTGPMFVVFTSWFLLICIISKLHVLLVLESGVQYTHHPTIISPPPPKPCHEAGQQLCKKSFTGSNKQIKFS